MGDVLLRVEENVLPNLAKAIMAKTGKSEPLTLPQFQAEVESISGGGSSGGAELNIHYGNEAPEDTSKLWCKCAEPSGVIAKSIVEGTESITSANISLPTATREIGVGVVGTKVYLFGGRDGSGNYLNTINEFDTETKTLTTLSATLPTGASCISVGVVGSKVYLFGGDKGEYLNTINVFDAETGTITTLSANLPTKTYGIGVGVVGTKIYLFGGHGLKTINVFDTETETLTTLSATLSTTTYGIGVGVVGTKVYLFGGYGSSYLKTINVFDANTQTITTLSATLPSSVYWIVAGSVGSKIYLFGGSTGSYLNTINIFDTNTQKVSTLSTTLPTGASGIGVGVVGTKIYLFGGRNTNSSCLNTINIFSIQFELATNTLLIQTNVTDNIFNIIEGIELGVLEVYLGNSDGYAESVEAYLYQNDSWTHI